LLINPLLKEFNIANRITGCIVSKHAKRLSIHVVCFAKRRCKGL